MANEIALKKDQQLPAHLQGQVKTSKIGNIDQSDLIIPRVKLLQQLSPECETFDKAKAGQFWHTSMEESLGAQVRIVPILVRKSYVLWAPRGDDRMILARANDGVHWVPANMEFTVKPKKSPKQVTWKTADTVAESGLHNFGTSIPEDPNSPPAASLTYQWMFMFPDFPELGAAIVINTRSAVKRSQTLIGKVEQRPVDPWGQEYIMAASTEKGAEGAYYNYQYTSNGYNASEDLFKVGAELHKQYADKDWRANDEDADSAEEPPFEASKKSAPAKERSANSKF